MLSRRRYAPRAPRYGLQLGEPRPSVLSEYVEARMGGSLRGASTAVQLLEGALAPSTYSQYGRLFAEFAEYCEQEGVSPLPASPWTVVAYIGHLAERGTWAAGSMRPIFSAINSVHRDLEFDPPAVGNHFLTRVRRGLERAQSALGTRDTRVPLPASAAVHILEDAEAAATCDLRRLRRGLAVLLAALFCGRQDSAVHLRSCDFDVDRAGGFIWLRLSEKGKKHLVTRRVVRLPISQRSVHGHSSLLPRVAALAERYLAARAAAHSAHQVSAGHAVPEFLLQLHGEPRPTTRHMEGWLDSVLADLRIRAPPGFVYQGHSIRSMGASCMSAIGVDRVIIHFLGGWARGSATMERDYIDPTVMPSPAAFMLYGWALSRQYSVGTGSVERAMPLPDPMGSDEW